jgi:hypothetical protein
MLEKVQLTIQAGMKVQEVTDLEVFMVLGKLGLSQADIVVMVVTSGIMLFLIFIFLFLGMALFSEGAPSDAQAVVNSLITAGSAVAFNSNASSGGDTKLMELLQKCMEYVKKLSGQGEFTFDVNEEFTGMLTRATKFQAKKDKEEHGDQSRANQQQSTQEEGKDPEEPESEADSDDSRQDDNDEETTDQESTRKRSPSKLERSNSKDVQTQSANQDLPRKKSGSKDLSGKGSGPSVVFCHQHFTRRVDDEDVQISRVEISTTTLSGKMVRKVVEPGRQVLLTTVLSHSCSCF